MELKTYDKDPIEIDPQEQYFLINISPEIKKNLIGKTIQKQPLKK